MEILNASFRAKDMIHQIAALGRKKNETRLHFLAARKAISASFKMMQSICPAHVQLSYVNHVTEQDGFLANETQINQVLLNLFVNASQSISTKQENGQVILSMEVLPTHEIQVKHRSTMSTVWEKYIAISVKDNGCGMNEETQGQIFNPFFTTKKKEQGLGLGLGLALVAQITEAHKGYIFVESTLDIGSEFFLYFPVVNGETAVKQLSRPQDTFQVLFIADQRKVLDGIEKSLRKLQVHSIFTQSTEEGRELLKQISQWL